MGYRWGLGLVALLLIVAMGCSTTPDTATPGQIVGNWSGRIEPRGVPLNFGVHFTDNGHGLGGTIDVPAQGVSALSLDDVRLDGRTVTFALPEVPGNATFHGAFVGSGDTTAIRGDFTQGAHTYPMTLVRGTVEATPRPQQPQPPYPYRSEDVSYRSGDVNLAGTLTLPPGAGPFTAVLLITGSGPQDRDETVLGHKPFLLLADTLTRAGYAVLRVDDRGVGGSGGDLGTVTYDDLVGDALAGVAYLRTRSDIDRQRIGLLGHSEGGYLGPLAAQRSDDVAFVIMMGGPAVPGEDVVVLQNRLLAEAAGVPPEQVNAHVGYVHELIDLLRAGDYETAKSLVRTQLEQQSTARYQAQRPILQPVEASVQGQTRPSTRALVTYDPGPALGALDIPVLAVFGGKDLQVPPVQSEPVLRQRLADNPDATVRTFPQLNHLMQPATTGTPDEYETIEITISPEVLDTVTQWLRARY